MTQLDNMETKIMRSGEPAAGMLCPLDNTALVMSERQGIEIDYCPTCRGVWLDRGELDKIIERSSAENEPVSRPSRPASETRESYASPREHGSSQREYGGDGSYRHGEFRKGRKKSFLSELFD